MSIAPDRFESARISLLRAAAAAQPHNADLRYELAERLILHGAVEEGAKFYREAYALEPTLRPASIDTSRDQARETAQRSGAIAGALLDAGVTLPAALVARAWSAAILGDVEEARRLIDFQALFYDTSDALSGLLTPEFRSGLVAEIRAGMSAHSLDWSAIRQASRNSNVLDGGPAGRALAAQIRAHVDAYATALSAIEHPFVSAMPEDYALTGWSVIFDGSSRHISHIHPRAWAIGVLYLQTDGVPADDGRHRGWLRVGPPEGVPDRCGWDVRWIEPVPGRLVMMPSYFTHETLATGTDGPRLCIAFDVVPRVCQ